MAPHSLTPPPFSLLRSSFLPLLLPHSRLPHCSRRALVLSSLPATSALPPRLLSLPVICSPLPVPVLRAATTAAARPPGRPPPRKINTLHILYLLHLRCFILIPLSYIIPFPVYSFHQSLSLLCLVCLTVLSPLSHSTEAYVHTINSLITLPSHHDWHTNTKRAGVQCLLI